MDGWAEGRIGVSHRSKDRDVEQDAAQHITIIIVVISVNVTNHLHNTDNIITIIYYYSTTTCFNPLNHLQVVTVHK
jgi:hypothetical protein